MVSDLTVICVHRLPGVGGPRTCIKSKDTGESRVFVSKVAKPKSRKGLDAPATFAVQIKPSTHFSYFKIRYSGCHCQRRDNFILRIYKFQMGRSGHHDPQPAAGGPGMGWHVANKTGPGMECAPTWRGRHLQDPNCTSAPVGTPLPRQCRRSARPQPARRTEADGHEYLPQRPAGGPHWLRLRVWRRLGRHGVTAATGSDRKA